MGNLILLLPVKMKIIILLRILWTGGAQKIAISEAKSLRDMGHDVKLVFLRETESGKLLHDSLLGLNWEIYSSSAKPNPMYSAITAYFSPDRKGEGTVDYDLIKKFANSLKPGEVDHIICHDQFAGIAGYKIKRRFGTPYSVFVHERVDGYPSKPIFGRIAKYVEKKVLSHANIVFSVTEKVAESIKRVYSILSIPNFPGMNIESCVPYEERENILLSVSVWDRDRDPSFYLPVLLKTENFKLIVAGRWRDEGLRREFVSNLIKLNLENRVTLLEGFSEEDLKSLYRKSKFSLRYGTDEYGPGMSNIEALSQCTPIIVYGGLGISDVISKYGCGFVSETWDFDEIVHFIKLNDNPDAYTKLQNEIMEISGIYTWEKHMKLLLFKMCAEK